MSNGIFKVPEPSNEPIKSYAPGSAEKIEIKAKLKELKNKEIEIPLIIGGKEVKTGMMGQCIIPHNKEHVLARYHMASEKEVQMAIEASSEAWKEWSIMPWEERASVFLKAAELLAGSWRSVINAATMLSQSKTVYQAEIDAACELIDFFRFNALYMTQIYADQPYSPKGLWNRVEYRPLEGFIFAVTPFNFTSIAGNLPASPALMGNTVVWKPASTAVYSGYFLMKLFQAAGLPDGVINFIPGSGKAVGPMVLKHPDLSGVHFTGSTGVFQDMWKTIGGNIADYKSYPRIVGETGGKDFIFVHPSFKDLDAITTGIVRGAFEYQGQKCSAASRAYIPKSHWGTLKKKLQAMTAEVTMGDVEDFTNFMGAVIDQSAFNNHKEYIDFAKKSDEYELICGGDYDDSKGYFVSPTIFKTTNPSAKLMQEEMFGPIMTIYVYDDDDYEETLSICDKTSPYALTGCIWALDRSAVRTAFRLMKHAAGNFYINDKPTAAVVGQQPFGGARASGTNDKAGSFLNLIRWTSCQTIKETLEPPTNFEYPFMGER